MTIARKLKNFMDNSGISYDILPHDREVVTSKIAQTAHISGDALAKGVLLKSDQGYLMAVVPASRNVDLAGLSHQLQERLGLATDEETQKIFDDCDPGAVPPCGVAYGMPMIIDEELDQMDDIYMEAGDHTSLIHMNGTGFARLTAEAKHATGISVLQ